MLKCIEFEDDSGPDFSNLIFLDCKTGGVGEISRDDCFTKKLITSKVADLDGNDIFVEAATNEETVEKLIKIINTNPRLKIGFGINKNEYDKEEVSISEMEKVQNMWGVKLKKTPKNIKGEEYLFLCQKTGQFGEMERNCVFETGLLTEVTDSSKVKFIEEAYSDLNERAEIVEKIRSLLKLGISK